MPMNRRLPYETGVPVAIFREMISAPPIDGSGFFNAHDPLLKQCHITRRSDSIFQKKSDLGRLEFLVTYHFSEYFRSGHCKCDKHGSTMKPAMPINGTPARMPIIIMTGGIATRFPMHGLALTGVQKYIYRLG
jgi:hypothetical protein